MIIYRIENASRSHDPISGIGAELHGGRWNRVGQRVVYCSTHRSLAMLEVLVHVHKTNAFPMNRVMVAIELPDDDLPAVQTSHLPKDWNKLTTYRYTQHVFEMHCQRPALLAVRIPSVIVPEEHNVMIDPQHADFLSVKIHSIKPIEWDKRLL